MSIVEFAWEGYSVESYLESTPVDRMFRQDVRIVAFVNLAWEHLRLLLELINHAFRVLPLEYS